MEGHGGGSTRLTQIAYAGGLIGVTSFTIATVTFSGASAEGAQAHPDVSRAIATGDVGPFLVAPMGFATLLGAGGLVALRTGVLPRWTAVVALVGAVSFVITFLTTLQGTADGSVFWLRLLPRHRRALDLVDRHQHREFSRGRVCCRGHHVSGGRAIAQSVEMKT